MSCKLKFFVDGSYTHVSKTKPTCVFPNGLTNKGVGTIKSIYECKNKNKLILKNINLVDTIVTNITFNIDGKTISSSSVGSAREGKYKISKNKVKIYRYGYSSLLGKNAHIKTIIIKCENKDKLEYKAKGYYKHNDKWIYFHKYCLTKK
jgi:membrane-bound inhibitor of C-type lysozyme